MSDRSAEERWLEQNGIECKPYRARISRAACVAYQGHQDRLLCPCEGRVTDAAPLPARSKTKARKTVPTAKGVGQTQEPTPAPAPPTPPVPKEETPMAEPKKQYRKTAPCACCGTVGTINGRGLIVPCYYRHKKAGTLEQFAGGAKDPGASLVQAQTAAPPTPHRPQPRSAEEIAERRATIAAKHPEAILVDDEYQPEPVATPQTPSEWVDVRLVFAPADEELLAELRTWAAKERRDIEQQILYILDNIVAERATLGQGGQP